MNKLVEEQAVVTISAGNAGSWADNAASGVPYLYAEDVSMDTVGSPGSFTNSLSVASVDNSGTVGTYLWYGEGFSKPVSYNESTAYGNTPIMGLDTSTDGSGTVYDYVLTTGKGSVEEL